MRRKRIPPNTMRPAMTIQAKTGRLTESSDRVIMAPDDWEIKPRQFISF